MQIVFDTPSGTAQYIKDGLAQAAEFWSSRLKDAVTVKMGVT